MRGENSRDIPASIPLRAMNCKLGSTTETVTIHSRCRGSKCQGSESVSNQWELTKRDGGPNMHTK